ncbi:MAG: translocation/assembly module TamB domain-containing protein, partial [Alphaproteobacteria bacterium]
DLAVTASRAADGTIRATELDAKGAHVALDGAATLGADMSVDARLGLRLTNLGVLADPLGTPIAGNVALTATAKGSLDRPTVQLQVTGGEVAVAGKRWRNVQATVDGGRDGDGFSARISARADAEGVPVTLALKAAHDGDDRLTIEDVTATAADARATGRATIVGTRPTQASGMLEIPDIGRLASLLGERAAGRISAEARLEPTGRGMRLTGKLTGRGLAAADLAIGSAEATATIDDPWERPRGRVRLRGDRITAAGQAIDFVALDLDGSPAGGIAAHLTASAPQPRPLAVDLNARLVLEANAMAATVERGHVQVAEQRIQLGAPLRLRWTGATLTADGVDLRLDQGRLAGDGSWSSAGATAALTLEQLPLAAAGRLAGIRGMQGRLDGRLTLDTRAQRPTAALALTGAGIRWRGTPRNLPPLAFALDGTWSNGRVRATAALRDVPDATLTLAAEGPLVLAGRPISFAVPPDGAISARADGSTDLARIAAYLPLEGMRLAGRLQVALEVGGTVATPRPGGRATLTEARVEEGGSGLVLAGLNAAVVGDGREFRLESLTATDGDSGRIEASGNARRSSDGWRADAAVVLRRFRVLASDLGRATASGRLEASAAPGGARLAGTLTVDEGDIALPSRPPAVARPIPVVEINRPDGRDIEPAPSAPAMVIALDLKVDIPGRLFVRGRGLDSEWRGSLTVRGTADAPQVFGSISTVRGRYDLIGRRFTVERGVISFDGDPAAASLDLLATATAGQLRATVTVTGSVAAPQLTLGSDPPLPQDEVLAQVLFGKSTAQMTPGQAVQLAQAAAELTGIGGGAGLVDRVRRSLGLDALDVGGESGTSVTLGKYVADGVFLKVNPNPGENASAVGVEIEVLPNVTVDAGVGGEGTNVGIKYRFDY